MRLCSYKVDRFRLRRLDESSCQAKYVDPQVFTAVAATDPLAVGSAWAWMFPVGSHGSVLLGIMEDADTKLLHGFSQLWLQGASDQTFQPSKLCT